MRDGADLAVAATEASREALAPMVELDWAVPAGPLELTCWATGVHIASSLLWYASQVALRRVDGHLPFNAVMDEGARPIDVVDLITVGGTILSRTIGAASPEDRAFHFWGVSDPDGFAAMGALETLVHTTDITSGLGAAWRPPDEICAPIVARLFPDAPADGPAASVLLWCTGRAPLAGRPVRTSWQWDAAVTE